MADQMQDMLDLPRDFVKEGTQFMNRCTKPDQKEFVKICQAVGVGCKSRHAVHRAATACKLTRPNHSPDHGRRGLRGEAEYVPPPPLVLLLPA